MYYPQEVLDEVLANTDIVDVVSAHVHLQKRGSTYVGLCPFHNEKTPSFNVNPGKQFFYCFGCGAGGSAITFLMKYNNSTFPEALQELADRAQITLPSPNYSEEAKKREKHRQDLLAVTRETAVYYYRMLRSKRGERGMRYFQDRALSPETMKMFGLGFADGARSDLTAYLRKKGFPDELILEADVARYDEKQGMHDRYFNRVMFPIQDVRGRVIGFGGRVLGDAKPKYINSSDTYIFDKGRNLYALNLARRSRKDYLILCEGYMDVIAMHQAGFPEAVASLGTAFTAGQAALLRRYTKRVLLAYDSDGAGVRAAMRNIGILRAGGLESAVIDLRPHKDPDEFIKAEGREVFQDRIDHAENSFFYELRIISGSYQMDDPSSRTAFHREIARKLCAFADDLERDNYITAAADKYMIRAESLRRLVAQYGNASGYGAEAQGGGNRNGSGEGGRPQRGGNARAGGKKGSDPQEAVLERAGRDVVSGEKEPGAARGQNTPGPGTGPSGRTPGQTTSGSDPAGRRPGSQPALSRARKALLGKQALLLTRLVEEPAFFPQVSRFLTPADFEGGLYREIAQRLWERMRSGASAGAAASLISSFETEEEQEMAAAILSRHPKDMQEDADKGKTLRELVYAVREASVERMLSGEAGTSLQEALAAKKELQTLRSVHFAPAGQM